MKAKQITLCGLFAAMMAICAWISVPIFDTYVTLQTFALALALLLLEGKWATLCISVYLLMGAVGAPIFSGLQGGFGALLGPTGGYLWGFLASALVYWGYTALISKKRRLVGMILALLCCYGCGIGWYYFAYAQGGLGLILLRHILPCIVPDILKIWLAFSLAKLLDKRLS